jgi:hypothetical protein
MIQPNQLAQATQELSNLIPSEHIPTGINKGEAEGYVFIGIKSRDNASGTAKNHFMKVLYAPVSKYAYMEKNKHLFGGLFNGMYNKIVILHNPTKPMAAPEKAKSKKLSNVVKGKIKTMFKVDGIPVEEIAKVLELDADKVKEYTSKL